MKRAMPAGSGEDFRGGWMIWSEHHIRVACETRGLFWIGGPGLKMSIDCV